jgi:hypothetical protein
VIYGAWDRGGFFSAKWAHPEIAHVILGDGVSPSVSAKGVAGMREPACASSPDRAVGVRMRQAGRRRGERR